MSYRPKNWKKTKEALVEKVVISMSAGWHYPPSVADGIEAGADAMLEGLKKEGSYLNGDTIIPAIDKFPEIHCPGGTVGWLVLIPDKPEEKEE